MTVTQRDLHVLKLLRRYKFLVAPQIRRLCFPNDKDGSITRSRLRKLEGASYVMRRRAEVAAPNTSHTMPVWLPTEEGCAHLALRLDDTSYLLDTPVGTRTWQNFAHYVAVSDFHLMLDHAIENQSYVQMGDLFFEHDVINPEANYPSERYRLNVVVQQQPKKIVCAPDSAFELQVAGYRRAIYVELERGTDTPACAMAKKHQGYEHLHQSQKFRLHFPHAQDLRVLFLAPTKSWRDSLRKEAGRKKSAELYLFASSDELTVENLLHGDLTYTCTEGPRPLVRPVASPVRYDQGENPGEGVHHA